MIQTLGSAGDTHPFLAVGAALQRRGHDVLVLGNAVFAAAAEQARVSFLPTGDAESFHRTIEDPDLWNSRKSLRAVMRGMVIPDLRATVAAIEAQLAATSVLVGSTTGFAARIVRELHEVPLVVAHLAPVVFRSNHRLPKSEVMWVSDRSPEWAKRRWWVFVDAIADRAVGPDVNEVRAERGLPPVRRLFDEWIHSPDLTIGLFPDWFGPPQPDWPNSVHLTGFPLYDDAEPLGGELEAWIAAGTPPVVFTAGTANIRAATFFRTAQSICATLDLRGVFVTRDPSVVPPMLPPTIRHETYAPFTRLLPRSRALVSHGGIGSTAQALAAGIPHLVAYSGFDQRDNGSRLADLGAGGLLPMRRFRGKRALQLVESTLSSDTATRSRELSELIDRDAALEATCRQIETVAT